MPMINDEYKKAIEIFEKHVKSFSGRKEKIKAISFSKINWSDTYLDFTPYESVINQLKEPRIFEKEVKTSIKNHFLNDRLTYCCHNENENWGSVFIDYDDDNSSKWLKFSEDYDDEMVLQQLKLIYHQNDIITKKIFYLSDKDEEEETFMVDVFNYDKEGKLDYIIRNGFYENKAAVLPERKISFIYENERVKIYSTQEVAGNVKKQLIYDGKELLD